MAVRFDRKNIRLDAGFYTGRRLYLATLCFDGRRRFGANPHFASWLILQLRKHAEASRFFVHAYCVMPDHMHVFAGAATDQSDFIQFVEAFKQGTAFEFSRRKHRRLWQFKYYDRILRGADSADRVAWYIWMNPIRSGLCDAPRDYRFSGSFTELGLRLFTNPVAAEWSPPWAVEV